MSDPLYTVSKAVQGGFPEVVFATSDASEIVEKFGDALESDAVRYYVTGFETFLCFTYTLEHFLNLEKSKDDSREPERKHDE